jgi:NADPH:quinone reductase-like Zn-dependent oxidoreductase
MTVPKPGPGQIRIRVFAAGVSPTDLKIRRGDLRAVFPLQLPAVIGFEVAGTVDAIGPSVTGVAIGDHVAALLPRLGGYAEYVLASSWTVKPAAVNWVDAAALPSSGEAAVGILKQLHIASGETLLVLGGGGSVGIIAIQLAVAKGLKVISANGPVDDDFVRRLGAEPVRYGSPLLSAVRKLTNHVDAVLDAAGKGGLEEAIELAGGNKRVMTLADERAAQFGVAMSIPTPDRAPGALDQVMALLASGALRLRHNRHLPIETASKAHALLEGGDTHEKLVLTTDAYRSQASLGSTTS